MSYAQRILARVSAGEFEALEEQGHWRDTRVKALFLRSKYKPHQGKQERLRRKLRGDKKNSKAQTGGTSP